VRNWYNKAAEKSTKDLKENLSLDSFNRSVTALIESAQLNQETIQDLLNIKLAVNRQTRRLV
jgi:hypothetical protein